MNLLTVSVIIDENLDVVWEKWTNENDVKEWNVPFDDWHCPHVDNDVVTDGEFCFRMEKKDGSGGFDYKGKYTEVIPQKSIETLQSDNRKSWIYFEKIDDKTKVTEVFEPVEQMDFKMQEEFTQNVLERFKKYVEFKA